MAGEDVLALPNGAISNAGQAPTILRQFGSGLGPVDP